MNKEEIKEVIDEVVKEDLTASVHTDGKMFTGKLKVVNDEQVLVNNIWKVKIKDIDNITV